MTRQADCFFIQEQLRDLWVNEPAFGHQPALLGDRPETPDPEQYDSTHNADGQGEDKDEDTTIKLGGDLGARANVLGQSNWSSTTKCHHNRNHALQKECTRARHEFWHQWNRHISFPLFRETIKEDAISNQD